MIKSLNSKFYILNSNVGQLLIESGIAISILVIGLLGIFGLLSRSLSLNNVVSSQYIASNLAAEGIEVVKNLIDADLIFDSVWNNDFISPAGEGSFEVEYNMFGGNLADKKIFSNFCDPLTGSNCSTTSLLISDSGFYGYSGTIQTPFHRTVNIDFIGSEEIKVNSIVRWTTRGGGQFFVNLEDHFFNWRP